MKTRLFTLLALCSFALTTFAQDSDKATFDLRIGGEFRSDLGLSYNFFTGDDADGFETSINGFGSGFLFDALSGRMTKDILTIGFSKANLSVGAGVSLMKYRFSEDVILEKENGIVTSRIDDDPSHDYGNGFFSHGKSKLVIGNFSFPVNLNFEAGPIVMSFGAVYERFLSGKHKRKFKIDGDKEKEVTRNDDFNDFNLNKNKFGLSAMIKHKNGLNAGITYMLTPFFEENMGPDIREVRISFSYDLSLFDDRY